MTQDKTPPHIRMDERNHVEKPLLEQLLELDWEIINLDKSQQPADSYRESFTEVVLLLVLSQYGGHPEQRISKQSDTLLFYASLPSCSLF